MIGELGCLPESLLNILNLQNKVKLSVFFLYFGRWVPKETKLNFSPKANWNNGEINSPCTFPWPGLNFSFSLWAGGGRICAFSYFSQSISLPLSKGAFLCIPAEIQGVTHPVNQHRRAEWSIFVRTAEVSSHMAKIKNKKGKGWSIFKKKNRKGSQS